MLRTDVASLLLAKYGKKNPAAVKAGDTVRVHQKIKEGDKERVQVFEGLVIATKHGRGLNGSFTVRKIAAGGIGVERMYPLHSPNIVKVERTKTADVSRAKLYYMRDRRGKSARFNNESQNAMSWSESDIIAEVEAELPIELDTTDEVVAEVVALADLQEEVLADVKEGETIPEEDKPEVAAE
jgi:large subunit ribosomal protein L19